MLGKPKKTEPKLFYHGVSLERRMPVEHPLRRIKQLVDFDFIRSEVADLYGVNGNPSVDPAVILKLMFLLFYENVKSERALLGQLPLRLDWLWFCDYDLDEATPDHSVLSKARKRWGSEVFESFFLNILEQCINAGLVDGETIHIDSSTIDGNADIRKARPHLRKISEELTGKLDEGEQKQSESGGNDDDQLGKRINPSDPDARIGTKYGKSTLGYKDHRVVDDKYGIITSTITTPANTRDDKILKQAVHTHEANTSQKVKTVVADKIYGTIDNYKFLHDKGATPCISHPRFGCKSPGRFSHDQFHYDKEEDCYICPAGQKLSPARHRGTYTGDERYYAERKTCEQCSFFAECVSSKHLGRTICHRREAGYIDWADGCLPKSQRRSLMRRRKYKAEGSFADGANNYGFKRARWRGGEKMEIQNLMIAAIQNLGKLIRYGGSTTQRKAAAAAQSIKAASVRICRLMLELFTAGNVFLSEY
jgi:transposase